MTTTSRSSWVPAFVCLGVLATASSAAAQTVAVAPFEGRGAGAVRRTVSRAAAERGQVADDAEVERAARSAGVSGTGGDGVGALARAVGADVIVQGELGGSRRAARLELVVRSADGAELARGTVRFGRGRRGRRQLSDGVDEVLGRALSAYRPAPRSTPTPVDDEIPEAPPSVARVDDEEPPAGPTDRPNDGLAVVAVLGGIVPRGRIVDIALMNGGARRYNSGGYVELALGFALRPLANDPGLARGIYVDGFFAHSVALDSRIDTGMMMSPPPPAVSTNFLRFGVDAGWLAPLGDVVELGVGLGFHYDGYHLGENDILPTAEYFSLRPAARARFRFLQEALVLDVQVAYRGLVSVGGIYGAFGADGQTHGVDVGGGIGGNFFPIVDAGFTWQLRVDAVGYFLSFAGPASDMAGSSGTEWAVRGAILVGWSFR